MKLNRNKINEQLGRKGMTKTQLAEKLQMSRQQMYLILSKSNCRPDTAARIASGLEVDISEITKED